MRDVAVAKDWLTPPEVLAKKIENLYKKLERCRQALKKSEEGRLLREKVIEKLKDNVKKPKLVEQHKPDDRSSDCLKIKQLLESLEEVETDNTRLRKVVMVDQQTMIQRLEKEVKELQRVCIQSGKDDMDCDIHEYSLPIMDFAVPDKEAEILQLKFEREQALWKLEQLQRRFHILFDAQIEERSNKSHLTCDYFIPSTTAPHAFAGKKLSVKEPCALSLVRNFSNKGLKNGTLPRERELEGLVEALLRVVERKRVEIEHLHQACDDTIQHIERSKQLQRQIDGLRAELQNKDERCASSQSRNPLIADLKKDVKKLKQANMSLVYVLKETEHSQAELQDKLHEAVKDKFSPRKRCSFNDGLQHEISDLDLQAHEISRLQKELNSKLQIISDLKTQLETRDDELDFLHGEAAVQEAVKNNYFESDSLETLGELRSANEELVKVCIQYEELLERQAEQLGVPFRSLRVAKYQPVKTRSG